jgi:hypothetical protein
MDFRWVAFITLWTLLSGPILATPTGPSASASRKPALSKVTLAKSPLARTRPAR